MVIFVFEFLFQNVFVRSVLLFAGLHKSKGSGENHYYELYINTVCLMKNAQYAHTDNR